ncbi:MAG: hypothetical protein AAGF23_04220 [Acidobacteriota bacterium]
MSTRKSRLPGGKQRERLRRDIDAKRQDVAHALDVLRAGAHREFAFLPKGEKWLLPSVAFALGVALAGGSKSKSSAGGYRPPGSTVKDVGPADAGPSGDAGKEDAGPGEGEKGD